MSGALLLAALVMGLSGGPHCAVMCGAACAGIARTGRGMLLFQSGRILGYSGLGALAAGSLQGIGWLAGATTAARPLWTMFHLAALLLGLTLVLNGRQPAWVDGMGRRIWAKVRARMGSSAGVRAPMVAGMLWAFMPCGLLYSALLLAALGGSVGAGAAIMAVFAVASAVSLAAGPWIWQRLRRKVPDAWGTRMAGGLLIVLSLWALWMVATGQMLPWCENP